MSTQLVEKRSNVRVRPKEHGQKRFLVELRYQHETTTSIFDDAGAETASSGRVAELATGFGHRRDERREAIDIQPIPRVRVDRQPVLTGHDDRVYPWAIGKRLNHITYRWHRRQARNDRE